MNLKDLRETRSDCGRRFGISTLQRRLTAGFEETAHGMYYCSGPCHW